MGVTYDDCCCTVKLKERKKERKKVTSSGIRLSGAILCAALWVCCACSVLVRESEVLCFCHTPETIDLRASLCIRQLILSDSSWNNVRVIVRRQVARAMQN
jgi:hypothetical protein